MSAALATAQQHYAAGRLAAAETVLRRALAGDPRRADLHNLLGAVLLGLERVEQAAFAFQRAATFAPDDAGVLSNLGSALFLLGRAEAARPHLERAVGLDPQSSAAWLGLASVLNQLGQPVEAAAAAERALALAPDDPACIVNRGAGLVATGRAAEALPLLREGLLRHPLHPRLIANYLGTLHYAPGLDAGLIAREHARLGPRLAPPAAATAPVFGNSRDPERPLRIGYLSSDLRAHSVAAFVRAFLPHHGRDDFAVAAIHTGVLDATSAQLRAMVGGWIDGRGVGDEALAQAIRRERLDVVVELNGHTQGARPGVIARRVAPVQLTYLGYPDRTGVPNIDGRMVDALTDPPGSDAGQPAAGLEPLIRLPRCFLAFVPPAAAPEPTPRRAGEPVTFGSFNTLAKLNEPLLALWARAVAAVPGSRLLLKNRGLDDPGVAAWITGVLAAHGVARERVELIGWQASAAEHWATYARVDIALDTFPYHGTTTTCEALWMGVPVVSRVGDHHAARVGASLLDAAGLADLATRDDEAFVAAARALGADDARRAVCRATLRERLTRGPLGDGAGLARALEAVYRTRWRAWCGAGAPGASNTSGASGAA